MGTRSTNLILNFRKVDGTTVISFDILPEMNMSATVDCVGILKERYVPGWKMSVDSNRIFLSETWM